MCNVSSLRALKRAAHCYKWEKGLAQGRDMLGVHPLGDLNACFLSCSDMAARVWVSLVRGRKRTDRHDRNLTVSPMMLVSIGCHAAPTAILQPSCSHDIWTTLQAIAIPNSTLAGSLAVIAFGAHFPCFFCTCLREQNGLFVCSSQSLRLVRS